MRAMGQTQPSQHGGSPQQSSHKLPNAELLEGANCGDVFDAANGISQISENRDAIRLVVKNGALMIKRYSLFSFVGDGKSGVV